MRQGWRLALRFALRELRGGFRGFFILIACIALGVGAIAGVNSVSRAITGTISAEGREILGGDLAVSAQVPQIQPQIVEWLKQQGDVAENTSLRAMARRSDGADQTLAEVKAAGNDYPLFGRLEGSNGPLQAAELGNDGIFAEPILLERLGVTAGEKLAIGDAVFTVKGVITSEPDRLSDGAVFGPRVLMSLKGLEKAGLVRPGSLVSAKASLKIANDKSPTVLLAELRKLFPDAGLRLQTRDNAAPSLSANVARFSQFLTLVGLAALVVGGVGVGNAARAFLEGKRQSIATLKAVGASSNFIFQVYLLEIMLIALVGILAGLVIGSTLPLAARYLLADTLTIPFSAAFSPPALMLGAAYGFLTAFVFVVWPIGQAKETPAATLFRSAGYGAAKRPQAAYIAMLGAGLAALVALALLTASQPIVAAIFLCATAAAFVALALVSMAIKKMARMMPKPRGTAIRMALANLHRPGSLTTPVVLSLGLGLTLIVALAMIDTSLRNQIAGNLPKQAPSFFMADVQSAEIDGLRQTVGNIAPDGKFDAVPMIRGRITHINSVPASEHPKAGTSWVLRGDRGITHSADLPANSTITDGKWWEPGHAGEPLVSFSSEEAAELDLKVGDSVTVNVLGRPVTARIANLRSVNWETLAINFVMVFSPNAFAGAPHGWLATVTFPGGASNDIARDAKVLTAVTKAYPGVTSVRVRDAINAVNQLVGQLALAIRAVSAIALVTAMLVLAGALAAGNRVRGHDAVVLKTIGATRRVILQAFVAEYAMLGLATALFAIVAGATAAWLVVTQVMKFAPVFDPWLVAIVLAGALVSTVGLGLAGTWRLLGLKAAPVLREL